MSPSEKPESGELQIFQLKEKVSIKKHQTGLVPVAEYEIEAQRIVCYNKRNKKLFPMKAVEVENNTETTLEGGNCVVLEDDRYIGESFIVNVKPDEPQLVTYAVEKNILVKIKEETEFLSPHEMKFHNDTKKTVVEKFSQAESLRTYNMMERRTTYTITNKSGNEYPNFYLDHYIDLKMELDARHAEDLHEYQTSEIFKRLKLSLGPEEVREYVVVEKKENHKSYLKKYLNKSQIETFKKQGLLSEGLEKEMDEFVSIESNILFIRNKLFEREKLDELVEKKLIGDDLESQLKAYYKLLDQKGDIEKKVRLLEEELREVFSDEKRLRENIKILQNENSSLKNK